MVAFSVQAGKRQHEDLDRLWSLDSSVFGSIHSNKLNSYITTNDCTPLPNVDHISEEHPPRITEVHFVLVFVELDVIFHPNRIRQRLRYARQNTQGEIRFFSSLAYEVELYLILVKNFLIILKWSVFSLPKWSW